MYCVGLGFDFIFGRVGEPEIAIPIKNECEADQEHGQRNDHQPPLARGVGMRG